MAKSQLVEVHCLFASALPSACSRRGDELALAYTVLCYVNASCGAG